MSSQIEIRQLLTLLENLEKMSSFITPQEIDAILSSLEEIRNVIKKPTSVDEGWKSKLGSLAVAAGMGLGALGGGDASAAEPATTGAKPAVFSQTGTNGPDLNYYNSMSQKKTAYAIGQCIKFYQYINDYTKTPAGQDMYDDMAALKNLRKITSVLDIVAQRINSFEGGKFKTAFQSGVQNMEEFVKNTEEITADEINTAFNECFTMLNAAKEANRIVTSLVSARDLNKKEITTVKRQS